MGREDLWDQWVQPLTQHCLITSKPCSQVPHVHISDTSRDHESTSAWPTLSVVECFPKSHLNIVWADLRPFASYPVTCYLEEDMAPHLAKTSFHTWSKNVSSKSSFMWFHPTLVYTHTPLLWFIQKRVRQSQFFFLYTCSFPSLDELVFLSLVLS